MYYPEPTRKRLFFLKDFLRSIGVRYADIPSSIIKHGAFHMALCEADDMNLSKIRQIIEYFGYELHIKLAVRQPLAKPNDHYKRYNPHATLHFLRKFLSQMGLNFSLFGRIIGLTKDAINFWFQRDTMMISRLYQIAYYMDVDLQISITQKEISKESSPQVLSTFTTTKSLHVGKNFIKERVLNKSKKLRLW